MGIIFGFGMVGGFLNMLCFNGRRIELMDIGIVLVGCFLFGLGYFI
jgi:hypothetical protein